MNKIIKRHRVLKTAFAAIMSGCLVVLGLDTASLLSGCATATIDEPAVCDTLMLGSVPASTVAGMQLLPTSFTSNIDFSNVVSKVQSVASSVNINHLTMDNNGDLNWLSSVNVSISADGMPSAPLASYTSSGDPGPEVNMTILMDSATILRYLSKPATLTFTLSGTAPTQSITFRRTMCVEVSVQVSKSL